MQELRCRDLGPDCDEVIRADTEEEVLRKVAEHGRQKHDIAALSEEQIRDVRSWIRSL